MLKWYRKLKLGLKYMLAVLDGIDAIDEYLIGKGSRAFKIETDREFGYQVFIIEDTAYKEDKSHYFYCQSDSLMDVFAKIKEINNDTIWK